MVSLDEGATFRVNLRIAHNSTDTQMRSDFDASWISPTQYFRKSRIDLNFALAAAML